MIAFAQVASLSGSTASDRLERLSAHTSRDEIGTERIDDVDVDESPGCQTQVDMDDPVDLRRLTMAPSHTGRVDEHLMVGPISASRRVAVMSSCSSRSSASRSSISARVDGTVEVGGVGAVLAAVGEEPAPVELGLLDEVEELVVVVLGLAGVADDEVAPECRVRLAVADVGDPIEEPSGRHPIGASDAAAAC